MSPQPQSITIEHLNPETLSKNPAFTQVITVEGPARTVYIGGQNAVTSNGEIVGKGDIVAQTAQVLENIQAALAAAGAKFEHIVKWNIYVVQGQPIGPAFGVFQQKWGRHPNPPTISMLFAAGLANPDFLVEVEAVAIVPLTQKG